MWSIPLNSNKMYDMDSTITNVADDTKRTISVRFNLGMCEHIIRDGSHLSLKFSSGDYKGYTFDEESQCIKVFEDMKRVMDE